jgi:RNA 2',3'-cyclic 3'-phosphodiesterase
MRLFVGIPLPDKTRAEIAAVVAELRRGEEGLRWSAPESWHITLQFLGNGDTQQLECLKARLSDVYSATVPLRLGSLGAFERAGVVFVDVEVRPELAELQQQVVAATMQCGFAPEDRPFRPHITLARTKARKNFRGLPARRPWRENPPRFSPFEAREFLLYESFTGEAGSRYEARARFALGT